MANTKHWYTNKDFLVGVMFLVIGGVAAGGVLLQGYPIGSAANMGPGYFPFGIGLTLLVLGAIIAVKGYKSQNSLEWVGDFRPLIILPAVVVAFGFMIGKVGLIPSLLVVAAGTAAAFRKFRWIETTILTVALIITMVSVFVWGLELPLPLLKFF